MWSIAHWLTSLRSRGDQVSSTQPEPPPCGFAHRREFGAPAIDAAEIAGQRVAQLALGRALLAERGEKEFVQDHRIARDQLLALETVDHEAGRCCEIELGELCGDCIETVDRAAVIVLVMADDELLRHSLDPRWVTGKLLNRIGHGSSLLNYLSGMIAIVSKWVTLSALVHSATLPASGERIVLRREQRLAVKGDGEAVAFGFQRQRVPRFAATLALAPASCSRLPLTTR